MGSGLADVRIAIRMLRARPGLSLSRLLTVVVVVAAVSAVFTVASATFLKPLPFPHPDRLTLVYLQPPGTTEFRSANPLQGLAFSRLRPRLQSFERLDGQLVVERALAAEGDPESIQSARVSAGWLPLLGATTALGRIFSEEEAAADARLVVLSHGLWLRRFGGDPSTVGRTLLIDREPHLVIGIVSAGFSSGFVPVEFWTPLNPVPLERVAAWNIRTLGALRPGVSLEQARDELGRLFADVRGEAPQLLNGWTANLVEFREAQFGARRPALYMLLAAVAALALIAAANLANLTFADVVHRRTDFAVRAALGGSRGRIAAPEIAQAVLLACAGGIAGLATATWLVPVLLALDPSSTSATEHIVADWRVALCAFSVAALVMLSAVALPALGVGGPRLASCVTSGMSRSVAGPASSAVRTVLVAAQTALALVLLSTGAVVVTTLHESGRIDPGFDPARLVSAQLRLPERAFPTAAARSTFIDRLVTRVGAVPGVVAAATTMNPLASGFSFQTLVHVESRPTPDGQPYTVQFRRVTPAFFATMRVPVLRGRSFDTRDTADGQPVAVVSRGFARRFWPDEDPIGKRIKRGATASDWSVVVGEVGDIRDISLDQAPIETVYVSVLQSNSAAAPVSLIVRTSSDPLAFVAAIRNAVWDVDPQQPLGNVQTMEHFLATSLGPQRFRALLVAACGVLGLLLATIGTYGVTARSVSERQREIGIRLALGGSRLAVWWVIAAASIKAVAVGTLAGALASAVAGAGLAALLPEVERGMTVFSAATGLTLFGVGTLAAVIAARAATAIPPLRALRGE